MRIYSVSWLSSEEGIIEAFSRKADAIKRRNHLLKQWLICPGTGCDDDHEGECVEHVNELSEYEFSISKAGIIAAFEEGASSVMK